LFVTQIKERVARCKFARRPPSREGDAIHVENIHGGWNN